MREMAIRVSLLVLLAVSGSIAWSAPSGQDPYAGYVYPAGGQVGTTFRITIRGQRLRGTTDAYISGSGVSARVVDYQPAGGPLTRLQQEELKRRIEEIRSSRMGSLLRGARNANKKQNKPAKIAKKAADTADSPRVDLPDIPDLRGLDKQSAPQLRHLLDKYCNPQKRPKAPIAEMVTLEITVDANASLGDRYLRLRTATGLTNPRLFQIGKIPEVCEPDPDEDAPKQAVSEPPVVLNGQIMPGEIDRFPLQLKSGQKLIIAAQARKLIPYLADGVPGWFQAVVSLKDSNGKEVAYDDDCGFDPDPALALTVPKDGQYTLEIRDALYRGREDFVYRVDIADPSLSASFLPSGSRGGVELTGGHIGWKPDFFASLPHVKEVEPNDTGKTCRRVKLPTVINGCISKPGDKDVYGIDGHAGESVVAEVYARRMGSPLDSLVQLIDTSGHVVAMNDDHEDLESGLLTQHVDSYLCAKLPKTGLYFVQISDSQRHGGPDYDYSLRISAPQPDFALRIVPSCLNIPAGRSAVATVYAVRKDGWDGDIRLTPGNKSDGFSISGGVIPKGRDHIAITIQAPQRKPSNPIPLQVQGISDIGNRSIKHPAVPADDMMQAFAYHHLVTTDQFLAMVVGGGRTSPKLSLPQGDRLIIPANGTAEVTYAMKNMPTASIHMELSDPPAGVTLQDVKTTRGECTLVLKADGKHIGYADNLIVQAYTDINAKGKGKGQKQRISVGILPAIPFEIVAW